MIEDPELNISSLVEAISQAMKLDTVSNILDTFDKEDRDRQKKTSRAFSYSGAGKRKFVIESSNWGATLEERQARGYEIGRPQGRQYDKFRDAAGKYWSYDKSFSDSGKAPSVIFVAKGNRARANARVPFSIWTSEPWHISNPDSFGGERDPFFQVKQVVVLKADKRSFFDNKGEYRSDNWRTLIEGTTGENPTGNSGLFDEHTSYDYLAFEMQLPFNYKQLDKLNLVGPQYAKIRPEYNFYIKTYEEMLRFGDGIGQPEAVFPNLYALMMEKMNEHSNKDFVDHISLAGILNEGEATVSSRGKRDFDIKKHAGQYFDLYGARFSKALEEGVTPSLSQLAKKYKNIVVPLDNVVQLKEMSDKKELFPMFVDMEFSTDKMTEFAQMLAETQLADEFMWSMVRDVATSSGFENMDFTEVVETSSVQVQEDGTSVVKKTNSTRQESRKVWNVFSWLKNSSLVDFSSGAPKSSVNKLLAAVQQNNALNSAIFLDDGTVEQNLTVDPSKRFFKSLLGVIFVGKLKTFLKQRFRTFNEMIEGQTCHSESVLYRVEKTLADEDGAPTGNTIQNFWFPNTNQIDVARLVDTQVKYGKKYSYRIYAYQLAVNTKYSYSNLLTADSSALFMVTHSPEVLLIEQEIFQDDQIILDDPPVPPEVEIVPYYSNGRKLLFNMKSAVGEYLLDPILLNLEDEGQHDDVRRAQKLDEGGKIRFKGDDKATSFEIYRIEEHPKTWSDFDNRMLVAVSNQNASTGEYVDTIESNKKYYYTCRSVDVHGHVSNPTDIYEVELANDEGSIYMKKRIVDFAMREPRHPSKSMRRLLQIRPAVEQTFLDTDKLQDIESAKDIKNIKLGQLEQAPWGRKFKFRIVSKKTGKKMDFNVDFKATMNRRSALK